MPHSSKWHPRLNNTKQRKELRRVYHFVLSCTKAHTLETTCFFLLWRLSCDLTVSTCTLTSAVIYLFCQITGRSNSVAKSPDPFFAVGHVFLHRGQIKNVRVVAQNFFAQPWIFKFVRSYSGHVFFMVTSEHEARPPDNSSFQHLVRFFVGAVKLSAPLNRASEQVMQADPRNADPVFQDVDPLLSVEGSHSFQGFQAGGHVEVVVVPQPVRKRLHALFCEHALTPVSFIPREQVFSLELRIPLLIFRKSRKIKGVEPLVRKPRFHSLAFVGFHPFLVAGPRSKVVHDVEKAEAVCQDEHDLVSVFRHSDFVSDKRSAKYSLIRFRS